MNERTDRITRLPGALAALAAVAAVALQVTAVSAAPPSGPQPPTTHPVTFTASPVVDLGNGSAVTFTVKTKSGTTLVGDLTAHLCEHGETGYGTSTFGYSGSTGDRCVYEAGIFAGGLTGADYEKTYGPYSGSGTTSGTLTFHAGKGTVRWGNVSGFGPFALTCNGTHPCDLVVEVNLAGDGVARTYFVQPLSFQGAPATTTTTVHTTTTTVHGATTTTTTTHPSTTTTVHGPTTTTTTTHPSSTTTTSIARASTSTTLVRSSSTTTVAAQGAVPADAGGGSGSLPFTGGSARDVASVGLLVLAAGLFVLGEHYRRLARS